MSNVISIDSKIGPTGSQREAALIQLMEMIQLLMQATTMHWDYCPEAHTIIDLLESKHAELAEALGSEWKRNKTNRGE